MRQAAGLEVTETVTEKRLERFFDFPAGIYCGVFIREEAAKRLQKILWRQSQEIKEFLARNKDSLETSRWTLAYPENPEERTGKQIILTYFDGNSRVDLDKRITLFNNAYRLLYVPAVFSTTEKYNEASAEVEKFYLEHYGETEGKP